jgi:uncharacterized protein (DUF488 family)
MEHYQIWTIGHSTRSMDEFIEILKGAQIELIVDVRRFPGSKKFPHFSKESLAQTLNKNKIEYMHLPELGGRRKAKKESGNIAWKKEAFIGYADYMETEEFHLGIERLMTFAKANRTAYMCSEAVWWRCHRTLISDYLKAAGWKVIHLMALNKSQEHPYSSAAKIVEGKLNYNENNQTKFD